MTASSPIDLLVVDDDDEFRETLTKRFSREDFKIQSAASGEQALKLAEQRNFDVAIFDMQMPGMSGLELLKRFKETHPECEIILLTGQGSIETAVEAMKRGAYDFLQKPTTICTMVEQTNVPRVPPRTQHGETARLSSAEAVQMNR